jgi:hypothetical protein
MTNGTVTYLDLSIEKATTMGVHPKPKLDKFGYTSPSGSPTIYRIKVEGKNRWLRVYALQFSNAASHFVRLDGRRLMLTGSQLDTITDLAAKEKSKRSSHVGQIVVLNELPDAVRWEILEVSDQDGMFTVREEGTDYRPQLIHSSQIHKRV